MPCLDVIMTAIFKKYMVEDHSSFFGGKPEIHFWFCEDPTTWARLLKRKGFKVNKNTTEACSIIISNLEDELYNLIIQNH